MADVFHFSHNFLTNVAAFFIADSSFANFRHHCGLIDINAINRNARFGPQHVPGTMINRGCATLGKKSQDFVRSPARDPNVISEIGHYNPRVINFPMSVFSGDFQRFIDP